MGSSLHEGWGPMEQVAQDLSGLVESFLVSKRVSGSRETTLSAYRIYLAFAQRVNSATKRQVPDARTDGGYVCPVKNADSPMHLQKGHGTPIAVTYANRRSA